LQTYQFIPFEADFWANAKPIFDSRKLINNQNDIFFCFLGKSNNPHLYVQDLYQKGIRKFVVSHWLSTFENCQEAIFIHTPEPLRLLQDWAVWHRNQFAIPVVGITGSNGKTIVKEWLFELLNDDLPLIKSPKSYNSQLGVALSVLEMRPQHQLAIFEAGISTYGEMQRLQAMIQPNLGIFTNIGEAHSEGFRSQVDKISEKLNLFNTVSALIYNRQNPILAQEIANFAKNKPIKLLSWGTDENSFFKIKIIKIDNDKTQIFIHSELFNIDFQLPFVDNASVENAIHTILASLYLQPNLDKNIMQKRLLLLKNINMRLQKKEGANGCVLIDDSYNNDLAGLKIALDFLIQNADNQEFASKTLILSDMLELGEDAKIYSEIAKLLQIANIKKLVAIGKKLTAYQHLFKVENAYFYPDTNSFLAAIGKDIYFYNEIILIKGARAFEFEKICQHLQKKIHSAVLEINLNSLAHNFLYYKNKLNKTTKIMAMVKAFAYGSGSFEVAQLLQYQQVDYLGVAYVDEGVALREKGIYCPIMVLNTHENNFYQLIKYNLEPVIFSFEILNKFIQFISQNQLKAQPIHIEIDTGMRRLGFDKAEWQSLADLVISNKNLIQVKSVFSHLAAAEDAQHDDFTQTQITIFEEFNQFFTKNIGTNYLRHILNSAGINRWLSAQYDMVRLGIGLYGIDSSAAQQAFLEPVATLKAVISQIRTLTPAQTVGYSRKGKTDKNTRVATISIGYADGFLRAFGNGKAQVLVNGQRCATIGNICMDMCFIDLGDAVAKEGDEVIIFGEINDIQQLAQVANTIPYEILTNISERINRVFYD